MPQAWGDVYLGGLRAYELTSQEPHPHHTVNQTVKESRNRERRTCTLGAYELMSQEPRPHQNVYDQNVYDSFQVNEVNKTECAASSRHDAEGIYIYLGAFGPLNLL